jgi:hypothetical protein
LRALRELSSKALSTFAQFFIACEKQMDELSYFGIGFTVLILGLACLMAAKLSSKTAYH